MSHPFQKPGRQAGMRISAAAMAAVAVSAAALVTPLLAPSVALAADRSTSMSKMTVEIPRDVLIFPATTDTGGGGTASTASSSSSSSTSTSAAAQPGQTQVQQIVTDAFRAYLERAGVGVVVYSKRLPSVERAVSEGQIKAEEAAAGPGDDARQALSLATIVGAQEYLTIDIENYKYDPNTRTATFNVSVLRNSAADNGAPLATVAKPAVGTAPTDVIPIRQEASAVENAADQVADEAFQDLYPKVAEMQEAERMRAMKPAKPAKTEDKKKKK